MRDVRRLIVSLGMIVLVIMTMVAAFAFDVRAARACGGGCALDLKLRDQDEPWGDGVRETWMALNMCPGHEYSFDSSFVQLKQSGKQGAGHLEIGVEYSLAKPPGGADVTADDMARMMIITRLEYYNGDWSINLLTGDCTGSPGRPMGYRPGDWSVDDVDGDGGKTFYDFQRDPLDNLPPPRSCGCGCDWPYMVMSVMFSGDAGNEFMGVGIDVDFLYTLSKCGKCGGCR